MAVAPFFPFLRETSIFQKRFVDEDLELHLLPTPFATNITISQFVCNLIETSKNPTKTNTLHQITKPKKKNLNSQ